MKTEPITASSSRAPITIGVVGLGRAGWGIHLAKFHQRKDFRVVAAADADPGRREEAAREIGCPVFETIDALLAGSQPELVVVATPSLSHEEDALKVLAAGHHCVLEKPMALSHAGALRVVDAARRTGRRVFVHHHLRFSNEFRFIKQIIASGILGRIFSIRLTWERFARRSDWQTLRKNGGGELNNNGPHLIDFALNLVNEPVVALLGDLQHIKDAGDTEDHVQLFMKTSAGTSLDLVLSSCCALPGSRTVILGSQGTLRADDDKQVRLRYYDARSLPPLAAVEGPAVGRKYGTSEQIPWQEEVREIVPPVPAIDFYDNVRAVLQDGAEQVVTPESAAEVLRIIELARR